MGNEVQDFCNRRFLAYLAITPMMAAEEAVSAIVDFFDF